MALGLPAETVLATFASDYRLTDYCPVPSHAAEAMARTFSDPTWRQDCAAALVVFNRDLAVEGGFGEAGIIGTLAKTHRLVVAQANNAEESLAAARKAQERHGKFDIVVIAGHGNGMSAACLGIEDRAAFTELAGMLMAGATVLLASCSGAETTRMFWKPDCGTGSSRCARGRGHAGGDARCADRGGDRPHRRRPGDVRPAGGGFGRPVSRVLQADPPRGAACPAPPAAPHGTGSAASSARQRTGRCFENADSDGDGQANWREYLAGTNPRSAQDVLKVEVSPLDSGGVSVRWNGTFRNGYGGRSACSSRRPGVRRRWFATKRSGRCGASTNGSTRSPAEPACTRSSPR